MKNLKKIVSIFCAVSLVTLIFSICAVTSVGAASASTVTISDFDRAPYTSFVKGVAVNSNTMNYMGGRFRQETVDGNSVAVYQFAKGDTADSGYNANGYGTRGDFKGDVQQNFGTMMLTTLNDSTWVPVAVKSDTLYTVSLKYKVLSVDTENYTTGLSIAMMSVKNVSGWNQPSHLSTLVTLKAVGAEWKTVTASFTTGTLTADHTAMALGLNGFGEVLIDDITITEAGSSSGGEGQTVTTSYTIDFTAGGYSDTNCTGSGAKFISRVFDPTDASNTVLKLGSVGVGSLQGGRNIEIADGNSSTTAFTTKPNTSYTITVKYKVVGGSAAANLQLHLGTQSAWASDLPKYQVKSISIPAATKDDTNWSTATYTFNTTADQLYKDYDSKKTNTNVVNHVYLVHASSSDEGYTYIDNITVTETYTVPASQTRTYNFSKATGWSAINGTLGKQVVRTTDPDDSNNKVMMVSGQGYSFELAEAGFSTSNAYILLPSTSYTISFKYKVCEGSSKGQINIYLGTQAAYGDGSLTKYALTNINHSAYTDGNGWVTVEKTFTTTANQFYKEYDNKSNKTHVVNKIYFVHHSDNSAVYVDDIVITNNNGTQPAPVETENNAVERYVISAFNYDPYSSAVIGDAGKDWRVSKRMFSTTDGDNSVLGYSYNLDIQADLINKENTGSGNRGSAMGTNGYDASCTNLVTTDGISLQLKNGTAYRVSFNYKVTEIGTDSYIAFCVNRGLYQYSWASNYSVNDEIGVYMFASEALVTEDWRYAEYTFVANYSDNTASNHLKIGMTGYGKALIDDIVVEIIEPNEVQPTPSSDVRYSVSNGRVNIDGYSGRGPEEIVIPQKIAGAPVNKVSNSAFVFVDNTKKLSFDEGLISIGDYAFQNMASLETISIPASVTSIGKRIFAGDGALKTIDIAEGNVNYVSIDGVLYNADKTVLIAYPAAKEGTSFTVPTTVREIADYAFAEAKNLEEIILPSELTAIGINAFENCSKLKSITIPSGITELKNSAFRGCTALSSVLADSVTVYGENVFNGCTSLYNVGDFNSNSDTDPIDALVMLKVLAENKALDYLATLTADINGDGTVDMLDSITLQRHLADWNGYEKLPSAGIVTQTYDEYKTDSDKAELVINLTNTRGNYIKSGRDIARDSSKEDITLILIIGQSNSTTSVGYASEYDYYQKNPTLGSPTENPTRPHDNTVYSGSYITELSDSLDLYERTDVENGKMFSGYSPALGKAINEATGTKVVFVQCASGATGVHEWTKNCGDYVCGCDEKGKGLLYSNAVKNYLKTYNALSENYNIVNMGYVWNQGEHEQVYAVSGATVHDEQSYYDAYLSMHTDLLNDLSLDFGGIVIPRSYYAYDTTCTNSMKLEEVDNEQHSRCSTVARHAQYRAANDCDTLFIFDNNAEKITYLSDDPSNTIHYAQVAYNSMGKQAGESIVKYLEKGGEADFEGITVYNWHGVELAKFDMNGTLVSGSTTVPYTADNVQLQIMINPLGTHYTYDLTASNLAGFVDTFGEVDWDALKAAGYNSFELVVNVPVK